MQCLMWTPDIVIANELVQYPSKMSIIPDQNVVETLVSGGFHPTFSVCICIGGLVGQGDDFDALGGEQGIEGGGVLAVIVTEQAADPRLLFLQQPGHVARLLCDPGAIGIVGDAGKVHASGAQLE